jgi:hypothetical protein
MLSYFGDTAQGIVMCNPGMCSLCQSQHTFGLGIGSSRYRRSVGNPHKRLRWGGILVVGVNHPLFHPLFWRGDIRCPLKVSRGKNPMVQWVGECTIMFV